MRHLNLFVRVEQLNKWPLLSCSFSSVDAHNIACTNKKGSIFLDTDMHNYFRETDYCSIVLKRNICLFTRVLITACLVSSTRGMS